MTFTVTAKNLLLEQVLATELKYKGYNVNMLTEGMSASEVTDMNKALVKLLESYKIQADNFEFTRHVATDAYKLGYTNGQQK